jgi:hypothetical protein
LNFFLQSGGGGDVFYVGCVALLQSSKDLQSFPLSDPGYRPFMFNDCADLTFSSISSMKTDSSGIEDIFQQSAENPDIGLDI